MDEIQNTAAQEAIEQSANNARTQQLGTINPDTGVEEIPAITENPAPVAVGGPTEGIPEPGTQDIDKYYVEPTKVEYPDTVLEVFNTDFYQFTLLFQEGIQAGFVLSDDVEYFPTAWNGFYRCLLVKPDAEDAVNVSKEEIERVVEDKAKPRAGGRPRKQA